MNTSVATIKVPAVGFDYAALSPEIAAPTSVKAAEKGKKSAA